MEYLYEAIEHNHHIPIKIFTQTIDRFPYHWHEDTEILFVLKGEIEITVEKESTKLYEGNVFLVNKNVLHYIDAVSKDGISKLLVLQFDINHFNKYDMDSADLLFDLSYEHKGSDKRRAYNQIRGILASMMKVVINEEEPVQLLVERYLMDLIIVLIGNFKMQSIQHDAIQSPEERIMEIIKYINMNCKDQRLTLDRIADYFHLSPQYLSRYFKQQVGVSLKKFIDNMRMKKSLLMLKLTDDRIIDIALEFGFPDAKAYYRVFKDMMGITPAEYREQNKVEKKPQAIADYFSINSRESLAKLFEYIDKYEKHIKYLKEDSKAVTININQTIGRMTDSPTKIVTFGYAPHGLLQSMDQQFDMIQRDIGFEYVRFHGIFCDDMRVFNIDSDGNIFYNFNDVDQLFDRLLEYDLKPFVELGFTPEKIASGEKTIFNYKANVTPPKDIKVWCDMLDSFIRHLINRYGLTEILSWYFEFWNEPEIKAFFDGTLDEFYTLFKASYHTIKSIDERIRVGGFGTIMLDNHDNWLKAFAEKAKQDGLRLDFFSYHVYQTDVVKKITDERDYDRLLKNLMEMDKNIEQSKLLAGTEMIWRGDESFVERSIIEMASIAYEMDFSEPNFFITEWNSSTDSRDLVHDTCYMAAYIVKTIIATQDRVQGLGFWTFSDIFDEFRLKQSIFHGGFGLITNNGIKKAGYHAFEFLSKLGNRIIWQSDEGILTCQEDEYQLLLFNYCHYNNLYSHFDYSQINRTNRYDVFKNQKVKNINLLLDGFEGNYIVEYQWVNRKKGSAFDAWERMGAPELINDRAFSALKSASEPGYFLEVKTASGQLELLVNLEPHEVQLVTIRRSY